MITLIGDVHGRVDRYDRIARKADFTLQVGDFGFHKEWDWLERSGLDAKRHKIICGNHDVPPAESGSPYALGDFGNYILGGVKFFYMRGAHSIDWRSRIEGVSWWRTEQLSYVDMSAAFDLYAKTKPSVVVTHECPAYLKMILCGEAADATSICLDQMWASHKPAVWIHGHHHKSQRLTLLDTEFVSLGELEVFRMGN